MHGDGVAHEYCRSITAVASTSMDTRAHGTGTGTGTSTSTSTSTGTGTGTDTDTGADTVGYLLYCRDAQSILG